MEGGGGGGGEAHVSGSTERELLGVLMWYVKL